MLLRYSHHQIFVFIGQFQTFNQPSHLNLTNTQTSHHHGSLTLTLTLT